MKYFKFLFSGVALVLSSFLALGYLLYISVFDKSTKKHRCGFFN